MSGAANSCLTFPSTKELLKHVDALCRETEDVLLFRGERNNYPTLKPSLLRLPEEQYQTAFSFVHNLSSHFWDDYLWPYVDYKTEGLYFRGKFFGDLREIEQVRSAPSYVDVQNQFQPLFQHYGWPTAWLDVTYDPRVAVFFSSFDVRRMCHTREGQGFFYYWTKRELREQIHFLDIVDLKHLSELLSSALKVEGTRPSRQKAAAISVEAQTVEIFRSTRHCLIFDRHDIEDIAEGYDYYFPDDQLKNLLEAHQRRYLKWGQNVLQPTLLQMAGQFAQRAANEEASKWKQRIYPYDLIERYQDSFYMVNYHRPIMAAASYFLSKAVSEQRSISYDSFQEALRVLDKEKFFKAFEFNFDPEKNRYGLSYRINQGTSPP